MKLQFDPDQPFQRDAVAAIADLFDGQPRTAGDMSVINTLDTNDLFGGADRNALGLGNKLTLIADRLLANTRIVQARNDIEIADEGAAIEGWDLFDGPANAARRCPHFSVEMETGTGKTYVYLRTIFELQKRYGFQKFIIVVPSVAIREGVLKSIEMTKDHFGSLFNRVPAEHFVYDAKGVNKLRQFATANTLQILIINIDAFNKNLRAVPKTADEYEEFVEGTEDGGKTNVIYRSKEKDGLGGRKPIEFIQAARPIVIIDEPQSVDATDTAQDATRGRGLSRSAHHVRRRSRKSPLLPRPTQNRCRGWPQQSNRRRSSLFSPDPPQPFSMHRRSRRTLASGLASAKARSKAGRS